MLDGTEHEVRLDWTYWSGRREIYVDGIQRDERSERMQWKSTQRIEVDGHACVVRTEPTRLISARFRITLEVDGREVRSESEKPFWEG